MNIKNMGNLGMFAKKKRQSNRNTYNGIKFDSNLEIKWYKYFELIKMAGDIRDFEYHKKFDFLNLKTGEKLFDYESDFVVCETDGRMSVYDCKGWTVSVKIDRATGKPQKSINPEYRHFLRTKKLIESQHDIEIKILK